MSTAKKKRASLLNGKPNERFVVTANRYYHYYVSQSLKPIQFTCTRPRIRSHERLVRFFFFFLPITVVAQSPSLVLLSHSLICLPFYFVDVCVRYCECERRRVCEVSLAGGLLRLFAHTKSMFCVKKKNN